MALSKQILSNLPEFIQIAFHSFTKKREIRRWNKDQYKLSSSPLAIKENIIDRYKTKYQIDTFIETGTSYGDMVWRQRNNFAKIYSIELGTHLAKFAEKRFRKRKHIEIRQGNSNTQLQQVLSQVASKSIIYLDAHYSGPDCVRGYQDCVVSDELPAIIKTNIDHIIIINDAHLYKGERDYPSIEVIRKYILHNYPLSIVKIEDNCIIIELITKAEADGNDELAVINDTKVSSNETIKENVYAVSTD